MGNCTSSASSSPEFPMTSSYEHQAASEVAKRKKKVTKTKNQDDASNGDGTTTITTRDNLHVYNKHQDMGSCTSLLKSSPPTTPMTSSYEHQAPSEPVANSSRCEAERQSSQVIVEAHIEAIPVQKDDEARRFEQQLQTKDDEILSLRTAIRDRDHEMKRFDNAWKDLQKELLTSRDEVTRSKAELEAAKAVKVAQAIPVQKDDEARRRFEQQLQTKDDEVNERFSSAQLKMEAGVGHDSHVGLHLIPHLERLDLRREIGHGSFGAVYEVKMNGLPCIAKGLHDILLGRGANLPVRKAEKEAIMAKFHKECALLGNLKHPNIVQFLGVHRSKDNDEWLVMEYLHMDLAKCLEMNPDIPLPLKLSILRDVSYGLLHLHSQAPLIIHRDLTAPNILLTQGMSAKIADLGVSKIFDIRQVQRSAHTAAPGTWAYMPPEALSPDPKYDAKLDVFSYGVLTLYVANQEFPIVHEPPIPPLVTKKQEIQIYKRKHWVDKMGVAHPLYSVVMSCLKDHPDHRPTSKELNDIITKLCTQHDNSCKNVLELIKENEEHKSQRRKLEMEIELKTQQVQSDNLCKELENRKVVMSDQRVLELQRELEMTKRSMKAENDKLKMDIEEHIGKCKDNHCKELENRKMVMSDQRVLELQRELEMTKISMKAENDKLKMEIKEYIGKFEALKQIIEKSNEEKIQNQRKLDQLGKEIEWLQNKSSRKSSSSTHEDYIRTLKGHVASLEEDIARLNQVIESKNRLISELDLKSIHVDTCTSRWNEDDIHEGLREHGHTCVPQDGRLAEGSNDANSNGLLQKLKAAEERMMAMEESYQSALIKIEVITAERDIFSDDFRKERDDRSRVVGEKGQVASELEAAQQKISEMSAKLSGAMKEKDHLSAGLRQSTDEHNRAKEEIAVKVAQVKQYQKQVEAYKQQLEQLDQMNMLKEQAEKKLTEVMRGSDTKKPMDLEFKPSFRSKPMDLEFKPSFRSGTPIAASHFSTPEDDSAAGIGTSLRVIRCNDLDTGLGTGLGNIVSPHTCLPASVAGMQQHPLSAPPTGSDRVPSPRIFSPQPPPHAGPPSLDNLPHPSAMAGSQGIAYPTLDQHQDEHVGSGDPTAPPDPNLTCPLCRLVFKKREIRLHAQECKYLK